MLNAKCDGLYAYAYALVHIQVSVLKKGMCMVRVRRYRYEIRDTGYGIWDYGIMEVKGGVWGRVSGRER